MSNRNLLKKLSPVHIVALICAVLIFAAVVTSSVIFIVNAVKDKNREFDYASASAEELAKYFALEENYTNLELELDFLSETKRNEEIARTVNSDILTLVAGQKNIVSGTNASYSSDTTITVGDEVNLYYRGYVLKDDGTRDYLDGMCNFSSASAYALAIGGGSFISGFADALVGKAATAYPRLSDLQIKGDSDNVKRVEAGLMLFVTYTRCEVVVNPYSFEKEDGAAESKTTILIDLSAENAIEEVNKLYGTRANDSTKGFYDYLVTGAEVKETVDGTETTKNVGQKINTTLFTSSSTDNVFVIDGKEYKYTNLKVDFALNPDYYEGYTTLDVTFPYNYGKEELNGKVGHFEIFVDSVKEYGYKYTETTEENHNFPGDMDNTAFVSAMLDNYLNKKGNEDLKKKVEAQEGANTEAKVRAYLTNKYTENYANTLKGLEETAILDALVSKVTLTDAFFANKTLKALYEEKVDELLISFRSQYDSAVSEGTVDASYTIEQYAKDLFGIEEGHKWHAEVEKLAKEYFAEKLVVNYLFKTLNLTAFDAMSEIKAEHLKSYLEEYGFDSLDEMTPAEKAAFDESENSYIATFGYDYIEELGIYKAVVNHLKDKGTITIYYMDTPKPEAAPAE